jgi:hypothetical protein
VRVNTWYFFEGDDEAKRLISRDFPTLAQKIDIPAPELQLGDITLVKKVING